MPHPRLFPAGGEARQCRATLRALQTRGEIAYERSRHGVQGGLGFEPQVAGPKRPSPIVFVPPEGVEPPTSRLKAGYAAGCVTEAENINCFRIRFRFSVRIRWAHVSARASGLHPRHVACPRIANTKKPSEVSLGRL